MFKPPTPVPVSHPYSMEDEKCREETYVKVGTEWKYLYRAVDSAGQAKFVAILSGVAA